VRKAQVSVTLSRVRLCEGFATEEVELPCRYEVIKVRGAITIDVGSKTFHVGDNLTEEQAVILAAQSFYDVTVTQ
jgi:hypothetical protein